MKFKAFKFLLCVGVMVMIMTACGLPSSGGGSQTQPTAEPPSNTGGGAQATEAPAANEKFFQEDFNGNMDNWTQFIVNGSKVPKGGNSTLVDKQFGEMNVGIQDGFLVFDLRSPGQWVYEVYDPQEYNTVRLDVSAENRGSNDNNISLICHYSPTQGWYEFNITNSGLYKVYYASVKPDNTVVYGKLTDGGYNKIKQGKETNQLGITCDGRTLALYINSYKVKEFDDNQYALRDGKIGISVSSFSNQPATVAIDWVKVSEP